MANENIYQRINYLFQAAYLTLKTNPNDLSMCRFYLSNLKAIARRHVLHLHPDLKRAMCKRCCVLLIPQVTMKIRTRNKKHRKTVITCLGCGTVKCYHSHRPIPQWLEKEESWEPTTVCGQKQVQQKPQQPGAQGNAKTKPGNPT